MMFNIVNQLLTHHSSFAPFGRADEWTAKPSQFSILSRLSESFQIIAVKKSVKTVSLTDSDV